MGIKWVIADEVLEQCSVHSKHSTSASYYFTVLSFLPYCFPIWGGSMFNKENTEIARLSSVTELLWKLAILLCSASVQSMMKKKPASFLHEWWKWMEWCLPHMLSFLENPDLRLNVTKIPERSWYDFLPPNLQTWLKSQLLFLCHGKRPSVWDWVFWHLP